MDVFLTKGSGLTSTEANYIANLSKEKAAVLVESLEKICWYDTEVASITSDTKQLMKVGQRSISYVQPSLEQLSKLFELCAWLREAIKAKDALLTTLESTEFEEWMESQGITLQCPDYPEEPTMVTEDDVLNSFSREKRLKYLQLEATAATIGKYIHPNGAINKARKELLDRINKPIEKDGTGRDTILFYHTPTIPLDETEKLFITLQELHRVNEQQLNYLKAEIKETANKLNLENKAKYEKALNEYRNKIASYDIEYKKLHNQYQSWKVSQREEIAKLRIYVPAELSTVIDNLK